MPELRRMRDEDVEAVNELSIAAFEELERRDHRPPPARPDPGAAYVRLRHLLATDPAGCWVADAEDGARAGFALHPSASAHGTPRETEAAPEVRSFTDADHALAAAVDRSVRGAPHGSDLDALAEAGCERLAFPGRGYAVHRGGALKLLAATDDEAAAALLRTVLARIPAGGEAEIEWLTGAQQWAIGVAVAAGLELRTGGGVFLRGETGSFRAYLPGGTYL